MSIEQSEHAHSVLEGSLITKIIESSYVGVTRVCKAFECNVEVLEFL